MHRDILDDYLYEASKMKTKDFSPSTPLPHFPSVCLDKRGRGGGICSGQNLTSIRIMTRLLQKNKRRRSEASLEPPASYRQLHYNSFSEDIYCPRVQSYNQLEPTRLETECPATWQLYPSPQTNRGRLLLIAESVTWLYPFSRPKSPYSYTEQLERAIDKPPAH